MKNKSDKKSTTSQKPENKTPLKETIKKVDPGLALSFLYTIILMYFAFTLHKIGDYGVETDFYNFIPHAKKIFNGEMFVHHAIGPVYILLLAFVGKLSGDYFTGGMLISIISSGFTLYFIYRIFEKFSTKLIASIVLILTAVNSIFIQYTYSAGSDMFFMALASFAVYYFLKQEKLTYKNLAILAVISGLVYLTRYNGVFYLIGVLTSIFIIKSFKLSLKEKFINAAIVVGVFLLFITPWGLHCLSVKGNFFYNENYKNIVYAVYGEGKVAWENKEELYKQFNSIGDVVLKDPVLFTQTMFKNVYKHFLLDMEKLVGWHIGALTLLGMLLIGFLNKNKKIFNFLLFSTLFFLILLTVFYNPRFSMVLIPTYIGISVLGIGLLLEKLKQAENIRKIVLTVVSLALIGYTFYGSYNFNSRNISAGPQEVVSIADWFNNNFGEKEHGKNIVARKPHIAYMLDMKFHWMPNVNNYNDLLENLRERNIDYLFFSGIEAGTRPGLRFLINHKQAPKELKPVVYIQNNYAPAVLYEVVK